MQRKSTMFFGNDSLDVLDKEPEKLLQVSGISQNKLKKIYNSYLANRGARDIIAFLMPHGITANKAIKFYQHYKEKTMNIVRNHPYQLCEISGIGFIEADKIAMSFGLSKNFNRACGSGVGLHTYECRERRAYLYGKSTSLSVSVKRTAEYT
ncbi:MAG: hypothetical protein L6V93_01690 [Clostridiales bacterium]|nr:MAG: hypothetical protein L6V93_01690 [Clostridiales bacterium]